ncbi:MAG: rhamnogalacturonan lyase [Prevotella sp.]|nr:rhamnogalacturonan lyase [Prevotella sp.]
MKKSVIFLAALLLMVCSEARAQRFTDQLGRGLVAVPTGTTGNSMSNLVTWRRLADEYYDVTYNLYKNGTKVASNLKTTCFNDAKGAPITTQYQVAAVVKGVEQAKCAAVTPWTQYVYKLGSITTPTGYLDIALATVYDRKGADVTANYEPNDCEMADLDGDGELEIIVKRLNTVDAAGIYLQSSTQFAVLDAYDVNWQTGAATLMWRIDCGPNMASMNSTELNIIAYDWDGDGKAEVVMRGADNMIVYGPDGQTQLYTIGDMKVNTRNQMTSHTDMQYAWTHTGAEYLIYMNGQTGALYQKTTFPLKRLETGESNENTAWGDNYGHRSSKYFMGAPYLDGRKPSLFLARGIYTRHKMIAMDLNYSTHQWSERWSWNCKDKNSPWFGQGYHNFVVADVDEDGRDEIVYGSMVIDDNGHGLHTTGYGHGDAQHVGDFNPYRKGLEFFGCLEESPVYGCDYRDATTGEVLYKYTHSTDDGRAMMANLSNKHIGSQGRSVGSPVISSITTAKVMDSPSDNGGALYWSHLNFRIYWDGDLCSEILDSPGTAKEAAVYDVDNGRLFTSSGCNMNNDSKNNPCFQGDIIGDWREEFVVRCGSNLRVYTTGLTTNYSMQCLWFDHQYRQAMVWQMMAYNQPPHLSYFMGEIEGITVAPPALTNRGRVVVSNGSTIETTTNHLLMSGTNDMTVSVKNGAAPYMLTVNTPIWVQGNDDNDNITTTTYTHTLTGGAFTGSMRLVKQGQGTLVLPTVTETYTGKTDVWGGTLKFDGTLQSSQLWMNRFTTLISDGGTFGGGITADYDARIIPGGENNKGSISTTTLKLNHGARMVIDLYDDDCTADQVNATTLSIATKTGSPWTTEGPKYLKPVIEFVIHGSTLNDGTYDLGAVGSISGSLNDIVVEGLGGYTYSLVHNNGHLLLIVGEGSIVLDESSTVAPTATAGDVNVIVKRTISANRWSTLCLPFDMTVAQWQEAFGSDAEIRTVDTYTMSGSTITVNFNSKLTGTLLKNTPYIIKTSADVTQFALKTTIDPASAVTIMRNGSNAEIGRFMGTYVAETVIPDGYLFLNGNKFYYSKGLSTSKAYRAYFWMKYFTTSGANILMSFDDETTGIKAIDNGQLTIDNCFDLQGRKVAQPAKGIYIQNGKKLIK